MPQTIARLYRTEQDANAAVNELREQGLNAEAVRARTEPAPSQEASTEATGPTADPVLETIRKAGIPREHAKIFAEGVERGEVLVMAIDPPFGFALTATTILDRHNPIAVELPPAGPSPRTAAGTTGDSTTTHPTLWHSAAPLSSWLGWPVLSNDPAPLSNAIGRPTLKTEPASSSTLQNIRKQSQDAAPLSTKIGMSVLSDDPAPLSRRFGWSLLSDDPAPLSRMLGWGTLLHDPAPLSSALGWKVLSKS